MSKSKNADPRATAAAARSGHVTARPRSGRRARGDERHRGSQRQSPLAAYAKRGHAASSGSRGRRGQAAPGGQRRGAAAPAARGSRPVRLIRRPAGATAALRSRCGLLAAAASLGVAGHARPVGGTCRRVEPARPPLRRLGLQPSQATLRGRRRKRCRSASAAASESRPAGSAAGCGAGSAGCCRAARRSRRSCVRRADLDALPDLRRPARPARPSDAVRRAGAPSPAPGRGSRRSTSSSSVGARALVGIERARARIRPQARWSSSFTMPDIARSRTGCAAARS